MCKWRSAKEVSMKQVVNFDILNLKMHKCKKQ